MNGRLARVVSDVAALLPGPTLAAPNVVGEPGFASCFDVDIASTASAALANLAHGIADLDARRVTATFATSVAIDGEPIPAWADLSGNYRTSDGGSTQFHCNFPHHAAGVVARLGCEPTRGAVQEAVLAWDADELESQLIADGMIAARMRTLDEWDAHPHAVATAALPLIEVTIPSGRSSSLSTGPCSIWTSTKPWY